LVDGASVTLALEPGQRWIARTWLKPANATMLATAAQPLRYANNLLDVLSSSHLRRVLAAGENVELTVGDVLYTPGERLDHVYFPTDGFISLVMPLDRSASLEVGLVGNEGMFGIPLVLGVDASPVRALVQGAGSALRLGTKAFSRVLDSNPDLERRIQRYVVVHMAQLAQAACCTRFHLVEARLARWLLMTQDRAHASTFYVTQEFLALMLGVRRVGVTTAAGALQNRNLIHYRRGTMTVLDRRGLRGASCGCYKADRATYDRIVGEAGAKAR